VVHDIDPDAPVFVAGHRGLVGSAVVRRLRAEGCSRILTVGRDELDLRDQAAVQSWFDAERPEIVVLAAGTVGGIMANIGRPAEFIYDNLMITASVVEASRKAGVRRLLNLGSSCIYPRGASQPITEDALLSGPLEPTNEPYAVAKIAGIRLCQSYRRQYGCDFISAMPTNLYGPGDNFDPADAHVLPALISRFHDAKTAGVERVTVWGTGTPRREFLHVDDLAECALFLLRHFDGDGHINVGTGTDVSIADMAVMVRDEIHPGCTIDFDPTKPDGMPRKLLDVSRIEALGWKSSITLAEGIASTYQWFESHPDHRGRGAR
jgi:GDP-L-fucose synthase